MSLKETEKIRFLLMFKYSVYVSTSARQTRKLGETIASNIKPGDIICLVGELGAGKTCLAQGIARGLGIDGYVNSPSFTLLNEYNGRIPMYHFDLYRIESFSEEDIAAYREYFYGSGVSVVEWADKMSSTLSHEYLKVELHHAGNTRRRIILKTIKSRK